MPSKKDAMFIINRSYRAKICSSYSSAALMIMMMACAFLFTIFNALFLSIGFSSTVKENKLPLIVSTWGNKDFQAAAQKSLDRIRISPSHRLLALVEGLSECENRQCDTTVGYGGSPDEDGETTLDAMLMDGPGQKMGAVADLREVKQVAAVAWSVMNHTKHSFIVGNQGIVIQK
jgi:N4-(beta-N-acetylglucosaminyl)-L-asparaginase